MKLILQGHVLWCFEAEVKSRGILDAIGGHVSGVLPFHHHKGEIALTSQSILLSGESEMELPLLQVKAVFLGFDDAYPNTIVKNFGATWSPLRLTLQDDTILYLIIDYRMGVTSNPIWFETLKNLLT